MTFPPEREEPATQPPGPYLVPMRGASNPEDQGLAVRSFAYFPGLDCPASDRSEPVPGVGIMLSQRFASSSQTALSLGLREFPRCARTPAHWSDTRLAWSSNKVSGDRGGRGQRALHSLSRRRENRTPSLPVGHPRCSMLNAHTCIKTEHPLLSIVLQKPGRNHGRPALNHGLHPVPKTPS
jgi:hypothetical protein